MNVWIDSLPLFYKQIRMALRFLSQPFDMYIVSYFFKKVN